jgi:hypothetical protein
MRMSIAMLLVLLAGACTGDAPASHRTCAGNLYDACLQEHDCMSENCHNFMAEGFQVCSTTCTPGNDTPCMTTLDGKKATCGASGICTPPAPNDCQLPRP